MVSRAYVAKKVVEAADRLLDAHQDYFDAWAKERLGLKRRAATTGRIYERNKEDPHDA